MKKIIDCIKGVDEWQVTKTTVYRIERYISAGRIETERFVEYTNYEGLLLLHNNGKTHQSKFFISDGDESKIVIKEASDRLDASISPRWSLPEPSKYENIALFDENCLKVSSLDKLSEDIESSFAPFHNYLTLGSTELFLSAKTIEIRNSLGVKASKKISDFKALVNIVSDNGRPNDVEITINRPFLRSMNLSLLIPDYAVFAIESANAVAPPKGEFDVLFMGEALDSLFSYFIANAGGRSRFEKWSHFKIGEDVVCANGDKLTIESLPLEVGLNKTSPFDENGLALKNQMIIEDGVFKQIAASKRYSDFLSINPIGNIRNIQIKVGKETLSSLYSGKFLELMRFSTFEPNPITGEFSSEIRTGYFVDGNKSYPIRGGSITGSILECFGNARFSSNIARRGEYIGPKGVRVSKVLVS